MNHHHRGDGGKEGLCGPRDEVVQQPGAGHGGEGWDEGGGLIARGGGRGEHVVPCAGPGDRLVMVTAMAEVVPAPFVQSKSMAISLRRRGGGYRRQMSVDGGRRNALIWTHPYNNEQEARRSGGKTPRLTQVGRPKFVVADVALFLA